MSTPLQPGRMQPGQGQPGSPAAGTAAAAASLIRAPTQPGRVQPGGSLMQPGKPGVLRGVSTVPSWLLFRVSSLTMDTP